MAEYRPYTVGADGHFTDFKEIVCQDDREAIEQAKALLDDHIRLSFGPVIGWSLGSSTHRNKRESPAASERTSHAARKLYLVAKQPRISGSVTTVGPFS